MKHVCVMLRKTQPIIVMGPSRLSDTDERFLSPQVICDSTYTVIAACCNTPGSTNDRQAYREAGFDKLVESLPGKYYVLGDAAYGATNKMIVPYPGCNLPPDQDAFNYFQSQGRMSIEQTFGIMVSACCALQQVSFS